MSLLNQPHDETIDDVDDTTNHTLDCVCDECAADIRTSLDEDRAA